uniref:Uncharacterized protein n=1 Tax=Cucumis melo TaxID=3656 RepID=A0A9I9EM14_CUCME
MSSLAIPNATHFFAVRFRSRSRNIRSNGGFGFNLNKIVERAAADHRSLSLSVVALREFQLSVKPWQWEAP